MPKIIVTQAFKFAHRGCDIEEFDVSPAVRETTDECAEIAVREGWAVLEGKAIASAPENKDAARQRKTKAD